MLSCHTDTVCVVCMCVCVCLCSISSNPEIQLTRSTPIHTDTLLTTLNKRGIEACDSYQPLHHLTYQVRMRTDARHKLRDADGCLE
jgi:hypothetical protein